MKKVLTSVYLAAICLSFGYANPERQATANNVSSSSNYVASPTPITTLLSPIVAVGIGVTSILMAPVGFFKGAADGASEAAKLSDNPVIRPISAILGSATGAINGTVGLPMETSTDLTQKAMKNGYLV